MSNYDYRLLLKQAVALLENEKDVIANAANLSSLLYHNLAQINWLGFYFLPSVSAQSNAQSMSSELVLGPFHGQVACARIPVGQGVCGTAFAQQTTLLLNDVHEFEGHIACDAASESEIVVPFLTPLAQGVLDVDSPIKSRFSETEKHFFEDIVDLFCESIV